MESDKLKTQYRKVERKYLIKYIQILKRHVKEELTPEEKDELNITRQNGLLLANQIKQAKRDHIEFIDKLKTSNYIQDKKDEEKKP